MLSPKTRNQIKQILYKPGKSRVLKATGSIGSLKDLEEAISKELGFKTDKKEDEGEDKN